MRISSYLLFFIAAATIPRAAAQHGPQWVNPETTVRSVSFHGNTSYSNKRLQSQIASKGRSMAQRLIPWNHNAPFFSPVELQKDVTRLRRFYQVNGFRQPSIDYITELDSAANSIRILFEIQEGPPLMVQSVDFVGPDGRAAIYQFADGKERLRWMQLREEVTYLKIGDRLTQFDLRRIEDRVFEQLSNRGYAFSTVRSETALDTVFNLVDVHVVVDAGPQAHIDHIRVDGNRSVGEQVVLRELPFKPGDRFEYRKLVRGQRKVFSLDLFRLALIDLEPDQEQDTTVTLRVRVEEASLRYLSAQTGYAPDEGLDFETGWSHRNFLGDARKLSVRGVWVTGWGALIQDDIDAGNRQSFSISLQQPHAGPTRATLVLSPFFQRREDPTTEAVEFGLSTSILYEVATFRPISLRHTYARAVPILGTAEKIGRDFYTRSVLELTAVVGRADDYIQPRRGLLVQPFIEFAGGMLRSDIAYFKYGGEATAYRPLNEDLDLTLRVFAGSLHPFGPSSDQTDPVVTERLDPVQFYAGGAGDVRGYSNRALGPKRPVQSGTLRDGEPRYVYEPLGGFTKLSGNIDLRFPLPFGGDALSGGIFFDFGQLTDWGDKLSLRPGAFRYGLGTGLRLRTPAGMIRLDLAAKLNPSPEDLRRASDFAEFGSDAPPRLSRRFNIHLSIGPTF